MFNLAKELNLESKVLLDYCKELGFAEITNQLNGLEPEQVDALKERVKKGPRPGTLPRRAAPTPAKPVIPSAAKLATKVQTLPKAKPVPRPRRGRNPLPAARRRTGCGRAAESAAPPTGTGSPADRRRAATHRRAGRRAEPAAPAPPQNVIPTHCRGRHART